MVMSGSSLSIERFRESIYGLDSMVPTRDGEYKPYVYLDNAATTPPLKPVLECVWEFFKWYSSVHRGSGVKSLVSSYWYEESRRIVADFLGYSTEGNSVIFCQNTTDAINKVVWRLKLAPTDMVLTSLMEHHSNELPWRKKCRVLHAEVDSEGRLDLDDLERKLRENAPRIRLVAITGASNVTGYINPIYSIAEMAHRYGAMILVDGAQLVPHIKVKAFENDSPYHLDFLAFSGHKIFAPLGAGCLIGPSRFFEDGPPDHPGGGTVKLVTPTKQIWTSPPGNEEPGSPNLIGVIALAKAIKILGSDITMERIEERESMLVDYLLEGLRGIPGITIYGDSGEVPGVPRVGVVSFNMDGLSHGQLAAALSYEGAIAVRSGCFCAHSYILKLLKKTAAERDEILRSVMEGNTQSLPGAVRVSLAAYNTTEEIDRFLGFLKALSSETEKRRIIREYVYDKDFEIYRPREEAIDPGELFKL